MPNRGELSKSQPVVEVAFDNVDPTDARAGIRMLLEACAKDPHGFVVREQQAYIQCLEQQANRSNGEVMTTYTDQQRQQVCEALHGRVTFNDPTMRKYAEVPSLSSEDVTGILTRARELKRIAGHADVANAGDIVAMIEGYQR